MERKFNDPQLDNLSCKMTMSFAAMRGSAVASCSGRNQQPLSRLVVAQLSRSACAPARQQHAQLTARTAAFSPLASLGSIDEDDDVSHFVLPDGTVDYYAVLDVDDDCTAEDVKRAYRGLAKECHPDYLGDRGHDICILLNEAYDTLSDPEIRQKYNAKLEQALQDDLDHFTGRPISKWVPSVKPSMSKAVNPDEKRGVFVDEFSCIGCKQCVWCAQATFRIEPEHGRSRVYAQWLDTEDNIQAAIDACPVSCIHWVDKDQLPALEHVMQVKMPQRVNVGVMMGGFGGSMDVFSATAKFMQERKRKEEARLANKAYSPTQEAARRKAAEELKKQSKNSWFDHVNNFMGGALSSIDQNVRRRDDELLQVGKRKRRVTPRWQELQQLASTEGHGGRVPLERALVLASVYSESEDSDEY